MMDNVAYQPGRETGSSTRTATARVGRNNDLWACLDDGADDDLQSDGCMRIATLNDLTAEWTGGLFDASGALLRQRPAQLTGHGVILDITGWQPRDRDDDDDDDDRGPRR